VGQGTEGDYLRLRVVAAEDRLYSAARNGRIEAREADSGRLVWSRDVGAGITGALGEGENKLLLGTDSGVVMALDRADGSTLWRARVSSEVLAPPAENRGVVAVHTGDGKLFGLEADSGAQRWIYDRSVPVLTLRATSRPMPVDTHFVDGFASGRLIAADSGTGELAWESTIAVPRGRSEIERMVDIASPPVVRGGRAYVAAFQGRVVSLELASGRVGWSREISSYSGLDVGEDAVYVVDERDRLWALDRETGSTLWRQEALLDRRLSAPTVDGNHLLVADGHGYFYVLHREDGRVVARHNLRAAPPVGDTGLKPRRDRRVLNAPQVVDDRVVVLDRDGYLQSLRLHRRD
jgi:outer membrane protein assembly factor BamB